MNELTGVIFNIYWPPEIKERWKRGNEKKCSHCGTVIHMAKVNDDPIYCTYICAQAAELERKLQ